MSRRWRCYRCCCCYRDCCYELLHLQISVIVMPFVGRDFDTRLHTYQYIQFGENFEFLLVKFRLIATKVRGSAPDSERHGIFPFHFIYPLNRFLLSFLFNV